jgi:hypothetical protein
MRRMNILLHGLTRIWPDDSHKIVEIAELLIHKLLLKNIFPKYSPY